MGTLSCRTTPAGPYAVAHIAHLMKDRIHPASDAAEVCADGFPAEEIFAAATTAVLLANAATGRVIAVNPAAQLLLRRGSADLVGRHWHEAFEFPGARELNAAAEQAAARDIVARLSVRGCGAVGAMQAAISTFFVSKESYLLLQLDCGRETPRSSPSLHGDLFDQLDDLPMGLVVTDEALCVEFANRAFLDAAGEPSPDAAEGHNLLRWLDLTQDDLGRMHHQMQQRQAAAAMSTRLRTRYGCGPMVEIVAIAISDKTNPRWGFVLRPRRSATNTAN
jgi:PAS domain-containing protein